MGNYPGPTSVNDKARRERARERAQSAFRSMLLAFAGGYLVLAIVAFIATKEIGIVILLAFTYLGIVVCGRFGQRWVLRNIDRG